MLPYWIEISPADLLQGTAVFGMAVIIFSIRLLMPTGRA